MGRLLGSPWQQGHDKGYMLTVALAGCYKYTVVPVWQWEQTGSMLSLCNCRTCPRTTDCIYLYVYPIEAAAKRIFKKAIIAALFCILPLGTASPASLSSGKYIVTLKNGLDSARLSLHRRWASEIHARNVARREANGLATANSTMDNFDIGEFHAYAAELDPATIRQLRENPEFSGHGHAARRTIRLGQRGIRRLGQCHCQRVRARGPGGCVREERRHRLAVLEDINTPSKLCARIKDHAAVGKIIGNDHGTVNRLAFNGPLMKADGPKEPAVAPDLATEAQWKSHPAVSETVAEKRERSG
ncbi:hypothetical protein PWT90_10598 [Aphanocladium album]|nr:hypothetical protein PWT90_10598 [Aphanocladium album]